MPFRYPVALELEGRNCVVIGGGDIAEHKVRALLAAGAQVTVIAVQSNGGLDSLSRRGMVELLQREYTQGDLDGAFLAVAATNDTSVNSEVFREAESKNILINSVDDIPHCNFAVPSVVRRGDLVIAISTGGKAPALAKKLRRQLSDDFGPEFGVLVDLLGEAREETIRRRTVDFETWAERWQRALDEDLIGLVRAGRSDDAKGIVVSHLEPESLGPPKKSPRSPKNGRVWIVGAGPGDPDLITVRGKGLIDQADVIVYDRLVHPGLVSGKPAIYVGKAPGRKSISQEEINAVLVRLAREGQKVVRLKGGDPFVFGRGGEEAEALARAGIEFEVVPGVTSAVAAPAYAGIPLTDRRHSSSVAILTGQSADASGIDWAALAASVDTIVLLMAVGKIKELVTEMQLGGIDPSTPAAVIENATLPQQRTFTATVGSLPKVVADSEISSPAVVVVGEVVSLSRNIAWVKEKSEDRKGDVA